VPEQDLSILDAAAVNALLMERRPEFVFNCAAYNAVDRAESETELANAVNTNGPAIVAAACRRLGAKFVHYSTNYVFDGLLNRPYVESDTPSPLSEYGRSKLGGEVGVLAVAPDVLLIRTAALFGGPLSFPRRILARASSGERTRVVSDQRVNPTYTRDLAVTSLELAGQGATGIVHVVAEGCCSWDEFARAVLAEVGIAAEVESIRSDAYPAAARRPLNGCLATTRYRPLRPWREALHEWAAGLK